LLYASFYINFLLLDNPANQEKVFFPCKHFVPSPIFACKGKLVEHWSLGWGT